jgi:hypothetical protein
MSAGRRRQSPSIPQATSITLNPAGTLITLNHPHSPSTPRAPGGTAQLRGCPSSHARSTAAHVFEQPCAHTVGYRLGIAAPSRHAGPPAAARWCGAPARGSPGAAHAAPRRLTRAPARAGARPQGGDISTAENKLVQLLGFDHFDLAKELLRNRAKVVWVTRLRQAQGDDERK